MFLNKVKLLFTVTLLASLYIGCEDSVSKVEEEDHLGEFIHHVEHEHFEGTLFDTISAGADEASASVMDSLGMVYRVVFSGTGGYLKYSFTDTASHERTLITDKVLTATITKGVTAVVAEENADLSTYTTEFIKMMSVYDMEHDVTYTIHVSGATAGDTVSFFMAPRGIEGEHDH